MLTEAQIKDTEAILIQVPTIVLSVLDIIVPDEKPVNSAKRIENYIVRELIELMEVIMTNKDVENWVRNLEFIAKKQAFNKSPEFRAKEVSRIFKELEEDQKGAK